MGKFLIGFLIILSIGLVGCNNQKEIKTNPVSPVQEKEVIVPEEIEEPKIEEKEIIRNYIVVEDGPRCRYYYGTEDNVTMRFCDNGLIMIRINGVQQKLHYLYFDEEEVKNGIKPFPPRKGIDYITYPEGHTESYHTTKYSDYDDYYDDTRYIYEGEEGRDRHLDEFNEETGEEY